MSRKKSKKYRVVGFLIILLPLILFFVLSNRQLRVDKNITENPDTQILNTNLSPITGLACANYNRRPFAVILAGDEVARPLSGIQSADMVFEMTVIENEMTRLMAVYICGNPLEIGSIRSARHDFIPLAMGLDAIFVHWGGSHFALDKLETGIIDNIDALIYSQSAFWRKSSVLAPHNGFTNIDKLTSQAEKLNYQMESKFEGYKHKPLATGHLLLDKKSQQPVSSAQRLVIGYPGLYEVRWDYNPETNIYWRWRGGREEKDYLTNEQVGAKNIIIMRAESRILEDQYNDVNIEGDGTAAFYIDGEEIKGTWAKKGNYSSSKLYFYDDSGNEIQFEPGKIWVEIIEPDKMVKYVSVSAVIN